MSYISLYNEVVKQYKSSGKYDVDTWFGRYFYRRIGNLLAPLFIKMNLSGNQVTLIGFLIGWAANLTILIGGEPYFLVGAILYVTFAVIDHVDGTVARYRGEGSYYGRVIDNVCGMTVSSFTPLIVAYSVVISGVLKINISNEFYLLLAGFAVIFNLMYKYGNTTLQVTKLLSSSEYKDKESKTDGAHRSGFLLMIMSIVKELSSATVHLTLLVLVIIGYAWFYPILILLAAVGLFSLFLIKLYKSSTGVLEKEKF